MNTKVFAVPMVAAAFLLSACENGVNDESTDEPTEDVVTEDEAVTEDEVVTEDDVEDADE